MESTVHRASFQDCNDLRSAWHTTERDQLGPLQLVQAPARPRTWMGRFRPNRPTPARTWPIDSNRPEAMPALRSVIESSLLSASEVPESFIDRIMRSHEVGQVGLGNGIRFVLSTLRNDVR